MSTKAALLARMRRLTEDELPRGVAEGGGERVAEVVKVVSGPEPRRTS